MKLKKIYIIVDKCVANRAGIVGGLRQSSAGGAFEIVKNTFNEELNGPNFQECVGGVRDNSPELGLLVNAAGDVGIVLDVVTIGEGTSRQRRLWPLYGIGCGQGRPPSPRLVHLHRGVWLTHSGGTKGLGCIFVYYRL